MNTKVKKTIYSPDGNVFVNDLDIKDDIIYFTETSTTQSLDTIAYAYAGGYKVQFKKNCIIIC